MAKWKDIIESPDFQRKSTDEQNRLLETYYNDKIANSSEWTPEEKKKIYNRMQFRLGGIQERLAESDPSFQKYAEGEERRDRYERQVKRYVKEPTAEERRMKGEAIRTFDPMNLVQTFGRDDTEARLAAAMEAEKPHSGMAGLTESLLSGVENSTVARLLASHVFKPEDYREYDRMRAYNPEGPVNRVAASAMSLLADSPLYEAGGMIGGPAGAFGLHAGLTELYRAKMNNEMPDKIGIDSLKLLGNVVKETGIGLAEGKIMELTMLGSGKIADEIGAFRAFKQYRGAGMLPKDMAYKSFRQGIGSIETSKFAKNALEVPATVAGLTAGSAIMRDQPITPEGIAETTMLIGLLKAIHGPAKMRKDITPESASRISEQLSEKLGVSKREATEIIKSPEKTGRAINSIYDLQLQLMREELAKSQSAPEAPKITEAKSEGRDSVKEFESRIPEPPDELLKPAPDLERRQIGEKLLNAPEQAEKWGNRTAERREGIRNVIDNVWEGIEKNATPEQFNNLLSDHTLISDYIDPHATGYAKLPLTDKGIVRNEISKRLDDYTNPKGQGEEPKYRRIFEKLRENEPENAPHLARTPEERAAYTQKLIERDTAENERVRKQREETENAKNAKNAAESIARTNSLVMSLGGPEKARQIDPDNLKPVLDLMNMGARDFENIIATVPAAGPVKYDPQNPGANAKAKIGGLLPSFKNASRQIERLFGKTMHDNFVFPITQGGHNYAVEQKSSKADFKSFVKLVENDSGKSFSLKERERIGAYLAGRQENGPEILAAMKREYITKEMLTPRETAIVDYFDRELPKLLDRLNSAREIAGLKPIEGISNYFTFLRKFSWAEEMGINPVFAQNEKWKDANIIDASPKGYSFQFGETRYESSRPLDLDAFYVFERYNNAALKSIHMTPVVGRLREMIDNHGLLDHNAIAHQYLTETLDYVGGKRGHHDPIMERIANKLSKNLGIYYLSANLNSIFIQPSAYALTFTSMGKYSIMGARDFLNPKMRKFAYDKSTELQSRVFDVAAEEITKSFTGKLGKIKAKAAEIGMTPMKYVDLGCAEATWLTGYNYATKHEGLSGKEAYLYADKLVARTQGSGARVHLAPVQRTPLGKAFTVFNTFMINSWNFMLDDVVGQSNLSHYSRGRQLGRFVAAAAIMNTMSEVMGYYVPWGITNTPFPAPLSAAWERINGQSWMESLNGDDPDRKGESLGMGALEAGKETMSMVPIVGGSFRRGGKSAGGAAAQTLVELFDMFSEQRGAVTKIKVAQMAGKLSGIPGMGQAMKGVKGYYNWTVKQERAAKKELTPGQEYRKMKAEANKDYNAMMSEYRKMQRGF